MAIWIFPLSRSALPAGGRSERQSAGAANASEFSTPQKTGAYIAAGLVLFVITFAVNAVARWVISRSAREE